MAQFMYLTPKPAHLPTPKTTSRLGSIIGVNILCFLLHILGDAPEAGEASRGYLHGSIIIDFVGQKGPSSKLYLLVLDTIVALLQLVGLALLLSIKTTDTAPPSTEVANSQESEMDIFTRQDLDAEERGVSRSGSDFQDGIELRSMMHDGGEPGRLHDERLLSDDAEIQPLNLEPEQTTRGLHPLEPYYTGRVVIADFRLFEMMKEQYLDFRNSVHDGT